LILGETGTGKDPIARAPWFGLTARQSRMNCLKASFSAAPKAPSPARSKIRSPGFEAAAGGDLVSFFPDSAFYWLITEEFCKLK
jgi:transcriptional regulator with AAA-type ATPase domain